MHTPQGPARLLTSALLAAQLSGCQNPVANVTHTLAPEVCQGIRDINSRLAETYRVDLTDPQLRQAIALEGVSAYQKAVKEKDPYLRLNITPPEPSSSSAPSPNTPQTETREHNEFDEYQDRSIDFDLPILQFGTTKVWSVYDPNTKWSRMLQLQQGDLVRSINGINITDMPFSEYETLEAEPLYHGDQLTLEIIRNGNPLSLEYTVNLDHHRYINTSFIDNDSIGVIELSTFLNNSSSKYQEDDFITDVNRTIKLLNDKQPSTLIIDLRKNSGGYLKLAKVFLSLFLPKGSTLLHEHYLTTNSTTTTLATHNFMPDRTQTPIIIFQSSVTASSSEVVIGALKEHSLLHPEFSPVTIIGTPTSGKGISQQETTLPFHCNGSTGKASLYHTVGLVYSPMGEWRGNDGTYRNGITPDIFIDPEKATIDSDEEYMQAARTVIQQYTSESR